MKRPSYHESGAVMNDAYSPEANAGFSLIELLVTITIMLILLGVVTMNFHEWQVKSKLEAQTRAILVDLNQARANAFTQKKTYGIIFQASSYQMRSYSTATAAAAIAAPFSNGTTVMRKDLNYTLTTEAGVSLVDIPIVFDTNGFTNNVYTIFVNPYNSDPDKEFASVNCLVISKTRVNLGKINGTECEFK